MLVLTRKARQGLWIGDNVHVTVLEIAHGRVKIGIEAPADVAIDREELRAPTHSSA
jgi:carbon storage regulator